MDTREKQPGNGKIVKTVVHPTENVRELNSQSLLKAASSQQLVFFSSLPFPLYFPRRTEKARETFIRLPVHVDGIFRMFNHSFSITTAGPGSTFIKNKLTGSNRLVSSRGKIHCEKKFPLHFRTAILNKILIDE